MSLEPMAEPDPPVSPAGEEVVPVSPASEGTVDDPLWRDIARKFGERLVGRLPGIGDALIASHEISQERQLERRLRLLEDAAGRLSISPEVFVERLAHDEDLQELFWRAWNAAGAARSKEKIRLLAAALAAVTAGQRLDVSSGHVILGVIESLEPIHLQTLTDVDEEAAKTPPMEEGGPEGVFGARRNQLERRSKLDPEVLGVVIADLEARRLVDNALASTYDGLEGKEAFVLTRLGDQIRKLLLTVADEM